MLLCCMRAFSVSKKLSAVSKKEIRWSLAAFTDTNEKIQRAQRRKENTAVATASDSEMVGG